jgi:hypothetical protein
MAGILFQKSPDPYATAQAQGSANREAAIATAQMNQYDQYGPNGTIKWSQQGWNQIPQTDKHGNPVLNSDGTPKTIKTPHYIRNETLASLLAQANNERQKYTLSANQLVTNLADQAKNTLGKPLDYSNKAIMDRANSMINPRLQKRFGTEKDALQTNLINRGIREGTQQWNDAMSSFNQGKNDAYSSESLNNRQQAISEIGMGNHELLNTIASLLGGSQIQGPQQAQTPQVNVGAPDVMGAVYNSANMKNQNMAGLWNGVGKIAGGLFGVL